MAEIGDLGTAILGGETSEQEKLRKARQRRLHDAYLVAQNYENEKYLGPVGGDIEDLRFREGVLQQIKDQYHGNDPRIIANIQAYEDETRRLKEGIEQSLSYTPDYYQPTTDYDVTGYDVQRANDISERAAFDEDPNRYAIPDYEAAAMQAPSEAAKARADELSLGSAKSALRNIEDVYQQGGLTEADRARLEEIQRANAQEARAAREAIMSDLAQKGMATSGNRVLGMLSAAQGSANRNNAMGLGVEQLAEQRAIQAMRDAGTLGNTLAQNEFNRQFQTGSAADEINRFNTIGARDVQQATRNAQDEYLRNQREMLQRDIEREQANEANRAAQQTAANQYLADTQNQEAQWGASARNTGSMFNAANQTSANKYRADQAWNQLMGYNTQQGNLGNLALGEASAQDIIKSQQPTMDYGQGVRNSLEFIQGISDLAGAGDTAKGIMGGGGGSAAGGGAAKLAFL